MGQDNDNSLIFSRVWRGGVVLCVQGEKRLKLWLVPNRPPLRTITTKYNQDYNKAVAQGEILIFITILLLLGTMTPVLTFLLTFTCSQPSDLTFTLFTSTWNKYTKTRGQDQGCRCSWVKEGLGVEVGGGVSQGNEEATTLSSSGHRTQSLSSLSLCLHQLVPKTHSLEICNKNTEDQVCVCAP